MLRRRSAWLLAVAPLLLAALVVAERPLRADSPTQVQFQARLTDATGKPLPDGTVAKITFVVFQEAAAVTSLWAEAHTNVPISRGVVSVQLGNGAQTIALNGAVTPGPNPLTASLFNGTTRYLQITVNSDPPLSPTIPLVSVPYALSAGSLNGKSESQVASPVGTIVDWLPPTPGAAPPAGWLVCNGQTVNDPSSPYHATALPDLTQKFTRGIASNLAASLGPGSLPDQQGQNSFPLSLGHSHNVNSHSHSLPSHSHTVTGVTNTPNQSTSMVITGVFHADNGFDNHTHNINLPTSGPVYAGSAQTGDSGASTDGALSNTNVPTVPVYVGLLKIIRIK